MTSRSFWIYPTKQKENYICNIDRLYNKWYNSAIFATMEEPFMVIKWDVTVPPLSGEKLRRGYVYLPEDYEQNLQKRYPVL